MKKATSVSGSRLAGLPIFPASLPDESLYSLIAHFHALRGHRHSGRSLAEMFGVRHAVAGVGLPSRVGTLARRLDPDSLAYSADQMIEKLTLFPYFSFFLTNAQTARLRRWMLRSDGSGLKVGIGLVAQGLGACEPLRHCSVCRHVDFACYGRPYWHRSHQLPGIRVCHRHGTLLTEVTSPANGCARHLLLYPSVNNKLPMLSYRVVPHGDAFAANGRAMQLALWSKQLLHAQQRPPTPRAVKNAYVRQLIDIGLATPSGRVRQQQLAQRVLNFHHHFNYLIGGQLLAQRKDEILPWVTRLVRTRKNAQHPLRHLLLAMVIFPSWEQFEAALFRARELQIQNKPVSSSTAIELQVKNLLSKERMPLRQAARRLGLSVATIRVHAESLGFPIAVRPKHIDREKTAAVRKRLRQGDPIENISRVFLISSVSVNRILRADPVTRSHRERTLFLQERSLRRDRLTKTISKQSLQDRQAIRSRAIKDVAWLYRHDQAWLQLCLANYPASQRIRAPRVDWKKRDAELLGQLQISRQRLFNTPGKPKRMTMTELGRSVGRLDWIYKLY